MLIGMRNVMLAGGGGLSAKSYVQDGLVAMWDGIENAGWGVHDSESKTWKDLTNNGYDLNIVNNAYFDDNALITADRNLLSADLYPTTIGYSTIEICLRKDPTRNPSALICFGNSIDTARMACIGIPNGIQFYNPNGIFKAGQSVSPDAINTVGGVYRDSGVQGVVAYCNAEECSLTGGTNDWYYAHGLTAWGLGGSRGYHLWNFVGWYYSVRLYNRALDAQEIAANYAVDKARFNLT